MESRPMSSPASLSRKAAKPVARLDWRTLITANPETPKATTDALDRYFEAFAQPAMVERDGKNILGNQPCLKCDEPLADGIMSLLRGKGGFEWGLVHGEGHCRECGWPARAYHFIKDAEGGDLVTLRNVILQYHPDFVSARPVHTNMARGG
jgi:hypothetical protein